MNISKKKTHKQFIKEFNEKNPNAENIEILEEYKNARIKIPCRCKIDGYEWNVIPSSLLYGHGCPKCKKTIKKTHEEFIEEMKKINSNIIILTKYQKAHIKNRVTFCDSVF